MSTLKSTLENLAAQFASSVVAALRSAPIDELSAYTGHAAPAKSAPKAAAPKAAPKAAAKAAPAPKAAAAPAPAKRGPGRPKKVAAAAPAPAPAPVKRGPGRPKKVAAAAPAPAAKAPKAAAKAPKSSGRLARRSMADIGNVVSDIVSLLGQHPEGLRSEQIRSALGLQAKELPRPIQDGLDAGSITKVGQKRATTYFAGKGKKKK